MRLITEQAVQAFFNGESFNKDNTRVVADKQDRYLYLHGHMIAKRVRGIVFVNHCGWTTNTTKERLNGILSRMNVSGIYQKAFVWYWKDGAKFKDGWNKV